MHELIELPRGSKAVQYAALARHAEALLEGERDRIANAANLCALLYHSLPDVNWVGFYFLKRRRLIVGPFQGRPACVRIGLGEGVCGTAAEIRQTLVVADVAAFPGHIYCDPASRAEIVVPLLGKDGKLIGVLDLDSPVLERFDEQDRRGLEEIAAIWISALG
jgi:L-methionine (R)-S-oxide reductase